MIAMQFPAATTSSVLSKADFVDVEFSPFLKRIAPKPQPAGRSGFLLLLLAVAALLVRPSDLMPSLGNWPVYQTIILLCLTCSVRRVMYQLQADVRARSVTLLLLTFGASIVGSLLIRGNFYQARVSGFEFFKIIIFYLLVLALIDSVRRLRVFVLAMCAFTLILAMLSVLSYEGLLDIASLDSIRQADLLEGGVIRRLVGTGIFNDPNDFCLMLVVAIACCMCFATSTQSRWLKLGWALPIGFLLYAVALTYSRGGLCALLGGAAVTIAARFGMARALLVVAISLAALVVVGGGRQTHVDLANPEDTFQTRLDRWSEALTLFKQSPLIGVGGDQQVELRGQVAHNTYIQNFAELGIVGGACFLGMLGLLLRGVLAIDIARADATLIRFRPFLAGAIAGYAIGLLSLSRGYTISTYLVFALGAAYVNLAPRRHPLRINSSFIANLGLASVATIVLTYIVVRVLSAVGATQ